MKQTPTSVTLPNKVGTTSDFKHAYERITRMDLVPESKKNHLWRKIIWTTDPEEFPLGPYHSVEVYCSEESNGYAVWYVRRLGKDDNRGSKDVENGDYLLAYYGKTRRDAAIERAVLVANSDTSPEVVIEQLDTLAATAQKM
jgi:hypothetical protein